MFLTIAAALSTALPNPRPGPAEPLLAGAFGPADAGVHRAQTTTSWTSVQETVRTLRSICSRAGGRLRQVSKANQPYADEEIDLAGERTPISRRSLWRLAGITGALYTSYARGWIYDGYFAGESPGYRQAFQYDDPFGAYGCATRKETFGWAVALMPAYRLAGGEKRLLIFELTPSYAREVRTLVDDEERERVRMQEAELNAVRRRQDAIDDERVAAFRTRLTIGSSTNCGMVLQLRGPIAEVQLPGGVIGPAGEKQFWVRRDALTDAPAPLGCTFGR